MSERLETLKKARERMIEDRDAHARVLAAPFDRDKAGAGTQQVHRDPDAGRRAGSRHQWSGNHFAERLNRGGREAQHQLMHGYSGGKGRTVAQCESSGCADQTSWFEPKSHGSR